MSVVTDVISESNPSQCVVKRCASCQEDKPVDEFHWASKKKNRRHGYCKECNRRKQVEYGRKARGTPLEISSTEARRLAQAAEVGSTRVHKGYRYEKVGHGRSDHPRADKNGWVAQHILVAEKKYGILIPVGFTVHHRNRNPLDNDPDNLEIRVGQHGKGGDLMPTLMLDEESRDQAVRVLRRMGFSVLYPTGDKRNVGKRD